MERKKEYPELNPDGTTMTDEDKAEKKGEEPKPWAPPPRRHED